MYLIICKAVDMAPQPNHCLCSGSNKTNIKYETKDKNLRPGSARVVAAVNDDVK